MADAWFRFYNSAVSDPKVQRLSPILFRFWINILCLASSNGGVLPSDVDMEFSLRLSQKQLSDFLGQLISAGLVDQSGEMLHPHNWAVRQYKSDSSTERVKRFRKRFETVSDTVSETGPDTEQIQSIAEQNRFAEFFGIFPRKVSKEKAEVSYLKALKSVSNETLLDGASAYAAQIRRNGTEERFILSPVSWLEAKRWTDHQNGHSKKSAFNSPEELAAQAALKEKFNGKIA